MDYKSFYKTLGFKITAGFGVNNDLQCSCGKKDCPSAGKHRQLNLLSASWADMTNWSALLLTGKESGVFVLDVDKGSGGFESLAELFKLRRETLPKTLTTITGGGGRHYFFKLPKSIEVKSASGWLGLKGIDIKGEGGNINLPPSRHRSGNIYEFEDIKIPISDCPRWIEELLIQNNKLQPKLKREEILSGNSGGGRNTSILKLCGAYLNKKLTLEEIMCLCEFANAKFSPPLDQFELKNIVNNAYRRYNRKD